MDAFTHDGGEDSRPFTDALFVRNPLPMWVYDIEELRLLAMNAAARTLFQCDTDDLATCDVTTLLAPASVPGFLDFVTDDAVRYPWTGTRRFQNNTDAVIELELTSYPLMWYGRPARCVIGTAVGERQRDPRSPRANGLYDPLTGLPNRTLFTDLVEHVARRVSQEREYRFAVLFIDLDRFRNINDSMGYGAGDTLLLTVAARLRAVVSAPHTIARFGGDQFGILLDNVESLHAVTHVADTVLAALAAPYVIGDQEVVISASIGIVESEISATTEDCLRDAAVALQRAKEQGKARYVVFDRAMHDRIVHFVRTERDLRGALKRDELRVHYQPIVNLATGRMLGFEALARWQHPTRGLVPPAEFVPVAEEAGLLPEIAAWIRRESCRQMRAWLDLIPAMRAMTMSVNIAATSFSDPTFVRQVVELLDETRVPPACFQLEITESAMMRNVDAIATLNQVRALGVRISMDDFGTGYSSLSYLQRLPIDNLKIDRSFVWNMGAAAANGEIMRAIVHLGQTLGMNVVAEGIETAVQRKELASLGCDAGQGYYFARPASVEVMDVLLRNAPDLRLAPEIATRSRFAEGEGYRALGSVAD